MERKKLIALGLTGGAFTLASISGASVFADETANAATNLTEAQPAPTAQAADGLAKAGQVDGGISVETDKTALADSVKAAQDAGVTVVKEADTDAGKTTSANETAQKQEEIAKDYQAQAETIKKATDDYTAAKAKHEETVKNNQADYDKKKSAYDAAKAQYDKDKAQYDQDLTAYHKDKAQYDQDLAAYNRAKTQYDQDIITYKAAKAKYDQDLAVYKTAKAKYDQDLAVYKTAKAKYDQDLAAYTIAKNKYDQDLAAYTIAKNKYDQDLAAYNRAKAQYDKDKAQYDQDLAAYNTAKAQYDKDKAQYDQDLAAYNRAKAQYDQDKAQYDQDLAAYNMAKAQYDQELIAYEAAKSKYDQDLIAYEKALKEAQAKRNEDGYLVKPAAQTLLYKTEPNAVLTLDPSAKAYSKDELNRAVQSWGISGDALDKYNLLMSWRSNDTKVLLKKDVPLKVTYTNLQNSTFEGKKISKVVYTYTLKETPVNAGELPAFLVKDPTETIWFPDFNGQVRINLAAQFYDEDGQLLDVTDSLVSFASLNSTTNSSEFVTNFNGEYIQISGSSITPHADGSARADGSNENKADGSRFSQDEWDGSNSPNKWYGAIVGQAKGNEVSFDIGSNNRGLVWFAFDSDIKAVGVPLKPVAPTAPTEPVAPTAPTEPVAPTAPTEPVAPTAPTEPEAPTAPTEPVAPTAPTEPEAPTAPTEPVAPTAPTEPVAPTAPTEPVAPIEPLAPERAVDPEPPVAPTVHYHYSVLYEQPPVKKTVMNTDGADLDKALVNKGSVVTFTLTADSLPAHRQLTKQFQIRDSLPSGYQLDLTATKEANKGFDVAYNSVSHTVIFTAGDQILAQLNADLSSSVTPAAPVLIGIVTNDRAVYVNNFHLNVNNTYSIYSQPVRVSTPQDPVKPIKHNTNKDGLIIDGQTVTAGSVNYYRLLWDLDQYKGIKASKDEIAKGFYYVDDFPEEALTVNEKDIRLIDSKGQAVQGVTSHIYQSLSQAPAEVQNFLRAAGISPKGAFQVFIPKDMETFYQTYVLTGNSITIIDPMTVKMEMGQTGGQFENRAYQIDFGNGYATDVVVNNVPKPDPKQPNPSDPKQVKPKNPLPTSAVSHNKTAYRPIQASVSTPSLPKTGEKDNLILTVAGVVTMVTAGFGFIRLTKKEN
ncbi:SspB-related isopeptide-forming adhesin [Streptococcus macacae]|uniref:Agglutinin receptor n=1 Tax=Streptococcus macacae NCTC 11558 TaxID=764298 RepID=G5JYH5_9STRE|nr:SspB-related isopeptide-forming adhesin [Streptococcus macacae]EHJ52010.1 agglutinin receptor [Streptococcus macacae NCTC 11558]SUN78088.1 streptococcal surface protein B [Streptococcus macacae NCTC 11558]